MLYIFFSHIYRYRCALTVFFLKIVRLFLLFQKQISPCVAKKIKRTKQIIHLSHLKIKQHIFFSSFVRRAAIFARITVRMSMFTHHIHWKISKVEWNVPVYVNTFASFAAKVETRLILCDTVQNEDTLFNRIHPNKMHEMHSKSCWLFQEKKNFSFFIHSSCFLCSIY